MRSKVIWRDVGAILKFLSFIFLLPIIVALIYNEWLPILLFLLGFVLVFLVGHILTKIFVSSEVSNLAESMVAAALVWLLASFLAGLPFLFFKINLLDAVFESMSAWTTTGLSVINVQELPFTLLFWRSVMQWIGGVGIIVLALIGIFRTGGSLYLAEARGEQLRPNIYNTVKSIWWIYVFFTALGVLALKLAGLSLFDAINHAMPAIATSGMSSRVGGVAEFNSLAVEIILMVIMFLGAISFLTHYRLFKEKKFYDVQTLFLLIIIGFATYFLFFQFNWRPALFQVVSGATTSGFSTVSLTQWPEWTKLVLILVMLIGGSTGSTAGGLKLFRALVFLKLIFWHLKKIFRPHLVIPQKVGHDILSSEDVDTIIKFIGLYILILVGSSFILILNGYPMIDAFFQTTAAQSNAGLATVASFGTLDKIVLFFNMWVGRLEVWPVLVLFFGWILKRR